MVTHAVWLKACGLTSATSYGTMDESIAAVGRKSVADELKPGKEILMSWVKGSRIATMSPPKLSISPY